VYFVKSIICLILGYFFGAMSPAALVSKVKHKNLQEHGSGNLGATNTMMVFGLRYGVFVLVFDLLKTICASRVARFLFPHLYFAGLIAACGAILGHIFPFYMNFQGGKGVACLAGLLMTYDFLLFLALLAFGILLMFVFNYGVVAPVTVAAMVPVIIARRTHSLKLFLLTAAVCVTIIGKHRDNFQRIKNGEELRIRAYFGGKLRTMCLSEHCEDVNDE